MVGRRGQEGESQRGAATKAADSSSSRLCTHAAGKCVRRTILVGLHGFAQARPNFYFSIPAGAKHGGQT